MELKLSKELAEICGIHAGDGYLRNDGKRRELEISGGYEEKDYYDKHVIPLFNKVFKIDIKGRFFYTKGTYGFVIRDIKVIEFMHELGFPYGSKSLIVKVPKLILKNKSLKKSFLRGYFDTDGHIGFIKRKNGKYKEFKKTRHYYPRLMFTTVSKCLAKDLNNLFNELDLLFFYYIYNPKKETENLKHCFNINGNKNLKKWMDLIGIKNSTKLSRFKIWKKHGFCPPKITYSDRVEILKNKINPNIFYKGL